MIPCVLKRCLEWSYDASWPDVSRAARTLVAPTPARFHVADARHISVGGRGLSVGVAGRGTRIRTLVEATEALVPPNLQQRVQRALVRWWVAGMETRLGARARPVARASVWNERRYDFGRECGRGRSGGGTHHVDAVDDAPGLALEADLDQIRGVGQGRAEPAGGQPSEDLAAEASVALPVPLVEGLDRRVQTWYLPARAPRGG